MSPSVLIDYVRHSPPERRVVCHFFIRDGRIEYLNSTHDFSGQTVSMRPVPDADDQFGG